jgi:sugar lactone lactonase YvrE
MSFTTAGTPQINIPINARWTQQGATVAGGNEYGDGLHQLASPKGLAMDEDGTLFIAEYDNHRVIAWKSGAKTGHVIAGGLGKGNGSHQLHSPTHVLIDRETDSLVICDFGNRRVVRWPRQPSKAGSTMIENIGCWGITMDNQGFLYVSDNEKHEVRRYARGDTKGTLVAGGNGWGNGLNQLNAPYFLFVDRDQSLYVSDWRNHRVTKWLKGASTGVHVAGEIVDDDELTKRAYFEGVWIDAGGSIYVAEDENDRVTRWHVGGKKETVVVGGNGRGAGKNQFAVPAGLYFDRHGDLYVSDCRNHRVLRFNIEKN